MLPQYDGRDFFPRRSVVLVFRLDGTPTISTASQLNSRRHNGSIGFCGFVLNTRRASRDSSGWTLEYAVDPDAQHVVDSFSEWQSTRSKG